MAPKYRKKERNFMFRWAACFVLRAEATYFCGFMEAKG
jgi:hypothetical protein